jgi:hypothetical protein
MLQGTAQSAAPHQSNTERPMLNSSDLAKIFFVASSALFASNVIFLTLWIRARERALRAAMQQPASAQSREPGSADLEHIVNAVDAIAIEVERISEAQRFTAQVLVERAEGSAGHAKRVPERVITPH